jgi:hypothetical protein
MAAILRKRYEVFAAVNVWILVSWVLIPCGLQEKLKLATMRSSERPEFSSLYYSFVTWYRSTALPTVGPTQVFTASRAVCSDQRCHGERKP